MTRPPHLSFTLEEAGQAPDPGLSFESSAAQVTPPAETRPADPAAPPASMVRTRRRTLADRSAPFALAAAALALTALAGLLGHEWMLLHADQAPPAASPASTDHLRAHTSRSPSQ